MENIPDRTPPQGAEQLKHAALRLFAERGIDGVTVRQIAQAAGQKNHAAVTYHFGSKDVLVRQLTIDGARRIDDQRNRWLDECEARGGPDSLIEVLNGLVRTSLAPNPPPYGECYNRFFVVLQFSNRKLFRDTVEGHWNRGYLRCIDHIRALLPDVPPRLLNQRLVFMGAALGGILSQRESELADTTRDHPTWVADTTLTNAATSLAAILSPPPTITKVD